MNKEQPKFDRMKYNIGRVMRTAGPLAAIATGAYALSKLSNMTPAQAVLYSTVVLGGLAQGLGGHYVARQERSRLASLESRVE